MKVLKVPQDPILLKFITEDTLLINELLGGD
jgi:hypothetical protein